MSGGTVLAGLARGRADEGREGGRKGEERKVE